MRGFLLLLLLVSWAAAAHKEGEVDLRSLFEQRASDLLTDECPTLRDWPWVSWLDGPPCPGRTKTTMAKPLDPTNPTLKTAIKKVDGLCALLVKQLGDLGIPVGLSVSLVQDQQELLSQGYGTIAKHQSEAPSATTIFNIGSVTKIFTSLALYQTVQAGKVSLTDPVTKFFNVESPPAFSINNPFSSQGADAVTLRSLAAQASGLPREAYCGAYPISSTCRNHSLAAQQNLEELSELSLLFSPFTGSHYSNLGLALLGRSLERVWREEYEYYMVDQVFLPLNMTSSGFNYTSDVVNNMATGYRAIPGSNGTLIAVPAEIYNTMEFGWSAPAGGMYASRADMAQFMMWLFQRDPPVGTPPKVLYQSYKDEFLAPGMNLPDGISQFGQGTWESAYANGYWTMTKGGLTASMASSVAVVPALKLGFSVMLNLNSGSAADNLNAQVLRMLVPIVSELLAEPPTTPEPLPANYQQMLGSYGLNGVAYVTLSEADTTSQTGLLSGQVFAIGDSQFAWRPADDTANTTVFQYQAEKRGSCLYNAELGTSGLVYITMKANGPLATLADQNGNLYNLPLLQ